MMNAIVEQHLAGIRDVARRYGVKRLEVFGSACTSDFDPERSDIDFLVEYPDDYDFGPWIKRLLDLEEDLAVVVGRDVDVVMISALKKPRFKREADKTRTVIYDVSEVAAVA